MGRGDYSNYEGFDHGFIARSLLGILNYERLDHKFIVGIFF